MMSQVPPSPGTLSGIASAEAVQRPVGSEPSGQQLARAELTSLLSGLDFHFQQIASACVAAESPPRSACIERIIRNANAFCQEIHERKQKWTADVVTDQGGSLLVADPSQSYDALRHSLDTSQKRCAVLNEDMLRMADANEDLMSTMHAVKSTNRRYVDQIQAQSDDLAKLTQSRLANEEQIEELTEAHKAKADRWRSEAVQRVKTAESDGEAAVHERRRHLVGKLVDMRAGLRSLATGLAELRTVQISAATEVKVSLADWRTSVLDRLGRQLLERLTRRRREEEALLSQLDDDAHAQAAKLGVERETRQRETKHWQERDRELSGENRHVAVIADGEMARLRAEIESAEMAREAEAAKAEQEHRDRADRSRDLAVQTATLAVSLETKRSRVGVLENRCKRLEAECQQLEETWRAAIMALKESDSLLDEAVSKNEALRRHMEDQRLEAQRLGDESVRSCHDKFETSLVQLKQEKHDSVSNILSKVSDGGQELSVLSAKLARLHLEVERRRAERTRLQRDCALWRAQEELATRLRAEVERELADGRNAWNRHLSSLREQQESLVAKQMEMDGELRETKDGFAAYKHAGELRAANTRKHLTLVEAKFQEADGALVLAKRDLHDQVVALASIKSEASAQHASDVEKQHALEKRVNRMVQETTEMKDSLTSEAMEESQRAQRAQKECEELHQRGDLSFQEARVGPIAQIAKLEQALEDLRENQRVEKEQETQKIQSIGDKANTLEADLLTAQELLNETEKQLEAETLSLRQARAEHTSAVEKTKQDSVAIKEKASFAQDKQDKLVAELDDVHRATAADRARHQRELNDLERAEDRQAREFEARIAAERRQREMELASVDERLRAEIDRQQSALEAAEVENRRLRRLVGQTRGS
eukprot:TRINITY_DN55019_c0_g1_i1.p1 TRINITY_DN55019_c0_g1~~TRINITY_DN55019_c0_g1_i1.p1  ORF type:complete len:888 (+),score=172.99 TRINITY_DN55019_c0_g1_i1:122-2785(+)